ncbi:TIGR02588 family protein [Pararhizobium sp.]|uniref:TIGR02588 family protein n=1 Tax=Pararhizobium sp. TaxID=1977563 RepID=UPI0027253F7B|nr:TIGR02588 family protein [Pararhizobium sp.]MDO9418439.1 TIGR02588 family protein [Pararhizobium sp.]
MTKTANKTHTEAADPHWIEWLTGILSALLVVGMITWVGKEALTQTGEPPELATSIIRTEPIPGGYRVMFEIVNSAETTAAAVAVRGQILENGEVKEESDVTFDYVPAESEATGAMFFRTNPAGKELRVMPVGYTDP